ncbi:DMT family transporter [Lacisediminihabitans sp. G11-30]|uniref:DMT family transporter n=2 Tax=Lacisediminihabitans changchengi TaxID=2787634 RepID=A0A934SUZ9_9MICO|nr:DMT family transporter [Lacisediminihabitans changchengi]
MLAVAIGVLAALVYGSADFIGGIASKRISPVRVTAIGGLSGLVVLLLLLPLVGGAWSSQAVMLGALSGVSGAIGVALLYACLAIGPMSILSPLTAVVSAIVPVLAGAIRGERLNLLGYVAIGIALVAVVLVGFVPEKGALRPSGRALLMAVGAGAFIGGFLIIIDLTPDDSGLAPLVTSRAANAVIMFAAVGILALMARRRGTAPTRPSWRPGLRLAVIGGVVDASANALLLLGLRLGELTIQSVLTALYPAGTIILAAVILRERIAPVQIIGLVLALVAAALLALA